jgi:hypothetical protein
LTAIMDSTFVLQTTWQTHAGQVLVTEFMPVGDRSSRLIRRVTGLSGTVLMRQEITIRPQYATVLPWVSRVRDSAAVRGAEILLAMSGPDALALRGDHLPMAEGHRHAGEFTIEQGQILDFELTWFPSHENVPAAVNVDAALELAVDYWTIWAGNCRDDGKYDRSLCLRDDFPPNLAAPAGAPRKNGPLYLLRDEAFQSPPLPRQPHQPGLWEMRWAAQYFTHSRVMMWAAFDSGVRGVRDHWLPGPLQQWEQIRDRLAAEVMDLGFNRDLNSFTQAYGGQQTDAALLALPQVGFLAYDDERMLGTVAQLEKELLTAEGLLLRYRTETGVDGLEPGEHPFLACSFWLVEQYARSGRRADATNLINMLVGLSNDLGLLSEEYSMREDRMAGNFPQAFSHLTLVRAADAMHGEDRLSLQLKH